MPTCNRVFDSLVGEEDGVEMTVARGANVFHLGYEARSRRASRIAEGDAWMSVLARTEKTPPVG